MEPKSCHGRHCTQPGAGARLVVNKYVLGVKPHLSFVGNAAHWPLKRHQAPEDQGAGVVSRYRL
jgi:hypothetical protein